MHSENTEHKINIADLGMKLYLIYIYISEGLRHGGEKEREKERKREGHFITSKSIAMG